MTVLPQTLAVPLKDHLVRVEKLHEADLDAGYARSISPMRSRVSIQARHGSGYGSMSR